MEWAPRPGRVKEIVPVALSSAAGADRAKEPGFVSLVEHLWALLRDEAAHAVRARV
ncbi:MAG: hypothetical protein M0002_08610 [Rhodospirillales bacterium]|nr:hypothetical protein [Rhodospirillales bacterium]